MTAQHREYPVLCIPWVLPQSPLLPISVLQPLLAPAPHVSVTGDQACCIAGSVLDLASTTAPAPQAAALAPGDKPLSFRKTPVSRSVPSVTSVPNSTFAGLQFPAGHVATAGPHACAPLPTSADQSREALQPKVDLLLREMQLLKGLLSRVVLGLKDSQALRKLTETPETPNYHVTVNPSNSETTVMEGQVDS